MSSLPGYKLEDFLSWNWNLVVEGQGETNLSLGLAEMMSGNSNRQFLSASAFKQFVLLFEGYREKVEAGLLDFDETTTSWRAYASNRFDFISEEVCALATNWLKELREPVAPEKILFASVTDALDKVRALMGSDEAGMLPGLHRLNNALSQSLFTYADKRKLYRGQVRWNWKDGDTAPGFARECKDHPAVRGSNYMEIAKLLETSGCSKHDPWWSWEVLGVIDTDHGKLVVCPGDWIIEPLPGLYHVLTDDQFRKLYQ